MVSKLFAQLMKHKFAAGIIVLLLAGGGYWSYIKIFSNKGAVRYATAQVQNGTLIVSITGSGQVSASNQVDVKPKASGEITAVYAKLGQEVGAGAILAAIDDNDAERAVRDAQINLESAFISLEKMRRNQEVGSETISDNLEQSYKDAYNKVSGAFLELPSIIELARSVLYDNSVVQGGCGNVCEYGNLAGQDFRLEFKSIATRAEDDYKITKDGYDPNFSAYRSTRLDAAPEEIISILKTTEKTAEFLAQAIKSEQNMLDALVNNINDEAVRHRHKAQIPQQVTAYQNSIGSAVGDLNGILLGLGSARRSIESAERSLKDAALVNPIDIKSQENTVAQRQAVLQDAKEDLANYAIRAPFAGVVAKLADVKDGDLVSGNTVIATLLTKQSIAQISLNEIDVARIKVGQKATLSFDAVSDLTITGRVAEVDAIGAVSQGVVSYTVKILFDTQDERVKTGMSVSAAIVTEAKPNVILIPNSAVKSQGGMSFVEVPDAADIDTALANISGAVFENSTRRQQIEVGLASDEFTEILGGLKEGDVIITRTIQPSSAQSTQTQQQSGGLRIPGLTGGGGGGMRGGGIR